MTNPVRHERPDMGNPRRLKVLVASLGLGFALLAAAETTLEWRFDKSGRTEVAPVRAETSFSSPTDLRWWTECVATGIFRRGVCVIVR